MVSNFWTSEGLLGELILIILLMKKANELHTEPVKFLMVLSCRSVQEEMQRSQDMQTSLNKISELRKVHFFSEFHKDKTPLKELSYSS
jgi:hypothetical protein